MYTTEDLRDLETIMDPQSNELINNTVSIRVKCFFLMEGANTLYKSKITSKFCKSTTVLIINLTPKYKIHDTQ